MSSGQIPVQDDSASSGASVARSVTANEALVSSIRASRHDAERRSLLRKSAAARAHQLLEAGPPPRNVVELAVEPVREREAEPQPTCTSWRAAAARQAYLSTLPPPPQEAEPLVRLCHKA